jgi:hypothetical protein
MLKYIRKVRASPEREKKKSLLDVVVKSGETPRGFSANSTRWWARRSDLDSKPHPF